MNQIPATAPKIWPPSLAFARAVVEIAGGAKTFINVGDFYETADGTDDAPSIRNAIAYAITNGIPRVVFSSKIYRLESNVTSASGILCGIDITNTTVMPLLILEGYGATLYKHGTDYGAIIHLQVQGGQVEILGFHFERNHLDLPNEVAVGLLVEPVATAPDVKQLIVEDCKFTDCHKPIHITGASFLFQYGKLAAVSINRCIFDFPRGSNMVLTFGGGQTIVCTYWVRDLFITACRFDGATSGTVVGTTSLLPVDGFNFSSAINTVVSGCHLSHFDVEGFCFLKQFQFASTNWPFTIPAIGVNFTLPFFPTHSTAGWQVGDRFKFLVPGVYTFTHELEVVAVLSATSLTAKLISGTPGIITTERWITHQTFWLNKHSASATGNVVDKTHVLGVTGFNGASPAIQFADVDLVSATSNTLKDCRIGIYARANSTILISGNIMEATGTGIFIDSNCGPSTISANVIRLMGAVPSSGINTLASGCQITNNRVYMDAAVAGYGSGVLISDTIGNVMTGKT